MDKTYYNPESGLRVSLEGLNEREQRFFEQAMRRFRDNVDWIAFDQFAFGMQTPIFAKDRSHKDVLNSPLFLALKDMSIQLGIQQGKIAPRRAKQSDAKGEKAIA